MKKVLHRYVLHVGKWTIVVGRWALVAAVGTTAVMTLVFMLAHIWLPTLEQKKADYEAYISRATGLDIEIGRVVTFWDELHPGLKIEDVRLYRKGEPAQAIRFQEVRATLALTPLLWGSLELRRLTFMNPRVSVERMPDGVLRVSGLEFKARKRDISAQGLLPWLYRLHNVVIRNGQLTWHDRRSGEPPLLLTDLDISLRNTMTRHRLRFRARFPDRICVSCSMTVDYRGNPFDPLNGRGRLTVRADGVTLEALPAVVRDHLPRPLGGYINTQLAVEFSEGAVDSARGFIDAADLVFPLPGAGRTAKVNAVYSQLAWARTKDHWRLDLRELELGLTGPSWRAGQLRLMYGKERHELHLQRANITDMVAFLNGLRLDMPMVKLLHELAPAGIATRLVFQHKGDFDQMEGLRMEAGIHRFSMKPYRKLPGLRGLSGTVSMTRDQGRFEIDSGPTRVTLPYIFRQPLNARRLLGTIEWRRSDEALEISGRDLNVLAEDGKGTGRFSFILPADRSQSPVLKTRIDFRDGNGDHASWYFPINLLSKNLLAWLDRALVGGRVISGHVIIDGPVRSFPFDKGGGKFEVFVRVEDGVVDYLPGWARIENANAVLLFRGAEMLITADSGTLRGLDVSRVVVRIPDLKDKENRRIEISGEVSGPFDAVLAVLKEQQRKGSGKRRFAILDSDIRGSGSGTLSLRLNLPVGVPGAPEILGEYYPQKAGLILPLANLRIDTVDGNVRFDQQGVLAGHVHGRFLGGKFSIEASRQFTRDGAPQTLFRANGEYSARGVAAGLGSWLDPYLAGGGRWDASVRRSGDRYRVRARVDTGRLAVKLPPPLEKPAGEPLDMDIRTEYVDAKQYKLALKWGALANARLTFVERDGKWSLWGGAVGLAEAEAAWPKQGGLTLSARAGYLDADAWLSSIGRRQRGGRFWVPPSIRRVAGEFGAVDMLDRHFGSLKIALDRKGDVWSGPLVAPGTEGTLSFRFDEPVNSIKMDLSRLRVPRDTFRESGEPPDPRRFPNVELKSAGFQLGDWQLGALDLAANHFPLGWQITRLRFKRHEAELLAYGQWTRIADKQSAELQLNIRSEDWGKTLSAIGSPNQVAGGEGTVKAKLQWKSVDRLRLENMKANVTLKAEDGRFLRVEQGAGRLLGLFELSALTRYLRLDFSTVFGKGYAFNKLSSSLRIEDGNAYTQRLLIKGPSADMRISGRVGLVDEDYDLVLGVNPSLAETLAITSWGLGVPQVGAAILLLKNVFKDRFAKGATITYTIKGSWDDPKITRTGLLKPAEEVEADEE